jgi:alkylated DNA repair dioxygenase AlkB
MVDDFDLAIDRRASVEQIALGDGSSWVHLVSGFVREADELFDDLRDRLAWERNEVLRYDRYVEEKRVFSAVRADDTHWAAVRQTTLHLESVYRQQFTGVAAIHYRDGSDFQGLHSDRGMKWLDDTLIAIVVLGVRRPFVLRQRVGTAAFVDRTPAGELASDVVLLPGRGDLLVMGGRNQRDWLHGVPAAPTREGRISLTWRWTSRRGAPDTNPGYFAGRQFSDRPQRPGYRRVPGQ